VVLIVGIGIGHAGEEILIGLAGQQIAVVERFLPKSVSSASRLASVTMVKRRGCTTLESFLSNAGAAALAATPASMPASSEVSPSVSSTSSAEARSTLSFMGNAGRLPASFLLRTAAGDVASKPSVVSASRSSAAC
jgi:hypothetical protein